MREFTDYIENHYKNSLPNIGHAWKAGQKVVAQYTVDDGFYRAKILSVSNNFAEVKQAPDHQNHLLKLKTSNCGLMFPVFSPYEFLI